MAVNKKIPKSRLMIQYDTNVDGQKKRKELPYRVLIMSNASSGTSKDAQLPLHDRGIRNLKNGVDATLRDMQIPVKFTVPNLINPKHSKTIEVDYILTGMKDFRPDNIAKKIPQINALLKLKEMLVAFEKDVDNNRGIKDTIDRVFSNQEEIQSLRQELPHLEHYSLEKQAPEDEASSENDQPQSESEQEA